MRVTSTNEVVWGLYNPFGIIQYYMVLYNVVREDSNYTDPYPHPNLIIFTSKSRTVSKFWRCSSISFKHTYVGCMFLDPHLTVHPLRYRCPFKTSKVTELRPLTQVSGEASMGNDMASKEWRYRSLKVAFFFLSPSNSHVSPLLLIDSSDPRSGQQS